MDKACAKFTVYFEVPFWVGIYECESGMEYEFCKITFGAEPKDNDVYEFILNNSRRLKFTKFLSSEKMYQKSVNPKRMQREIKKQLQNTGMGTKAQQALKLLHEQSKAEKKKRLCNMREDKQQFHFELRKSKRKEKHKGH